MLDTFSKDLLSYADCQDRPETLTFWTHFQDALSGMQVARKGQETLTAWTHFQQALLAMQVATKGPMSLTSWTHFQQALSAI